MKFDAKAFAIFGLFFIATSGFAVAADDQSGEAQQSDVTPSAPSMKVQEVGGAGVLDYNYALDLPKFHGIEPHVSFNYSSNRKSKLGGSYQGWLGHGWGVGGFDVVERARKNGSVPSFSNDYDVFQLNGDELVDCRNDDDSAGIGNLLQESMAETELVTDDQRLKGASCAATTADDGDAKATRYENYQRIVLDNSSPRRWAVTGRDGTKAILKSTGELQEPALVVSTMSDALKDTAFKGRWLVSTVQDVYGNTVNYTYDCYNSGRVCYPKTISYGAYKVRFYLESRPVDLVYGNGNSLTRIAKRVKSVVVSTRLAGASTDTNIQAWALDYSNESGSEVRFLAGVRRFGSGFTVTEAGGITQGLGASKNTTFQYAQYDNFTAGDDVNSMNGGAEFSFVDVNSDGISEILQTVGSGEDDCSYRLFSLGGDGAFKKQNLPEMNCFAKVGREKQGPAALPGTVAENPLRALPAYSLGHFASDFGRTHLLLRDNNKEGGLLNSKIKWILELKKSENGNSFIVDKKTCGSGDVNDQHLQEFCGTEYPQAQVADLSGDGLDELRSLSFESMEGGLGAANFFDDGSQQMVYIRANGIKLVRKNASGDVVSTLFKTGVGCPVKNGEIGRCSFGDVNGDGLDDLIITVSTATSQTAEACESAVDWEHNKPGSPLNPPKNCTQEINLKVFLGVGSFSEGFQDNATTLKVYNGTAKANVDGATVVADIDGDGAGEIIFSSPGTAANSNRANKYLRLVAKDDGFELKKYDMDIAPSVIRVADLSGDGLADLVFRPALKHQSGPHKGDVIQQEDFYRDDVYGEMTYYENEYEIAIKAAEFATTFRYRLSKSNAASAAPYLLKTVSTETGAKSNFEYTASTQFTNKFLPFPVWAVTKVAVDDGTGKISETDYMYEGGDFNPVSRKFLGFRKSTQKLPKITDSEPRPSVVTTHKQEVQAYGLPEKTEYFDGVDAIVPRKTVTNTWDIKGKKPWRARNTISVTTLRDGSVIRNLKTQRTYDLYNNVTEETNWGLIGETNETGDETKIVRNYNVPFDGPNRPLKFIVSAPFRETVYNSATSTADANVIAKTEYWYNQADVSGTPDKKAEWPSPMKVRTYRNLAANAYSETCHDYDTAGNRIKSLTMKAGSPTCVPNSSSLDNSVDSLVSKWDYDTSFKLFMGQGMEEGWPGVERRQLAFVNCRL